MKTQVKFLTGLLFLSANWLVAQMEEPMISAIDFAESQMRATLTNLGYGTSGSNPSWQTSPKVYPKVTSSDSGETLWSFTSANQGGSWGAGFFPGIMWDLYSLTDDPFWLEKADAWTTGMEPTKLAGGDNRMNIGFFMMNSYARRIAYGRKAGDAAVMDVATDTLLSSWMPEVGSLYSFTWNRGFRFDGLMGGWSDYENTIIDSSPNIEILFHQAKLQTDVDMWDKALSHFNNLIRDNIRADGSTAQLASYDASTGEFLGQRGHQGYSFESTWSRGQGWALHGFASAWRETRNSEFGDAFHQLYLYYRDNCPPDGVPYWDFEAPYLTDEELEFRYPDAGAPALRLGRDSSAASLTASALMLASQLTDSEERQQAYFAYGQHILRTLCTPGFLAMDDTGAPTKESILGQGSYTFPGTEKGQIWGDFFFVEALRRYRDLVEPATVFDQEPDWGDFTAYSVLSPERWRVVPDSGDPALRLQGRTASSNELPVDLALYRHSLWQDFDFQFEVRADELLVPENPVDIVFVCGYIDEANYLMVRPSTSASRSGIFKVMDGVAHLLDTLDPIEAIPGFHTINVAVSGNRFQIEIDGSSLLSVTDPAIGRAGYIGFGGTGRSLLFDAISVTGVETVADLSPRETWRETVFPDPRSILSRDEFDFDQDGRANLLEFAFGTNPLLPDGDFPGPTLAPAGQGAIELTFPYNGSFSDITYRVMESLDGGAIWNPVFSITPSGPDAWETGVYSLTDLNRGAVLYRLQVFPRR